jgi:type I restriction enzyme S subunit
MKISGDEYAKALSGNSAPKVGDVLFSKDGTVGKVHVVKETQEFAVLSSIAILRPDQTKIDSGYLGHALLAPSILNEALKRKTGSAIRRIILGDLKEIKFPLPKLAEQKRIASILDKADSLRRKRLQSIRLADDFLHAVFLDMFGDPVTNPKGWQVVKLGELAKSDRYAVKAGPFGSALKKECYVSSGYRIYGQEQVIRDDLTFGDYYINEDKYRELESCKVESGDMLISLVGTFGKICIVPPEFEPGIINPRLMKVSFDPLKATPRFMKALLTSDSMVRKIESLSHGGTMGIVNVGIMKELEIPVPPVAIQIRFEEVQQKLATLKANYDAAEEQTTSAFSALQSRYFS